MTRTMALHQTDYAAVSGAVAAQQGGTIGFDDVSVTYGGTVVLDSLSLTVNAGEIVSLIGPSGSGKTTALRAVAGFVRPSAGRITIGGRDVTDVPPYERNIGMVVQNYALFPHMRVDENVAFGLRAKGVPQDVIRARVPECLAMVGMGAYARRYPRELSGGQQQRVAIARAIAPKPQVLLLDEPLSALDAQIRRSMLDELAKLHRELPSLTVLYVTHDQSEALTLANHIGIMRDGKLRAFGDSRSLFRHPPNRFAAEFLGRANLVPVTTLHRSSDGMASVRHQSGPLLAVNHHGIAGGTDCLLCIRPHDFKLEKTDRTTNTMRGRVLSVQWQGDVHNVTVDIDGVEVRLSSAPIKEPPATGDRIEIHFDPSDVTLVPEDGRHG